MATGSGKTFTVGSFVNDIFELRRKFLKINKATNVPRIHALVLNDRINLVNQLNVDFFQGRDDKEPLINNKFQKTITSRTYHSKADDIEHEDIEELLPETGEIDIQVQGKGKDIFDFVTFQTAVNGLDLKHKPNLIIIDEAHHLSARTYYQTFLQYYKPDENGVYPLVILMSATPDRILHLTGDPLVQFGLPEWIAHEDSPDVNYHLVTNNNITSDDIQRVNEEIVRISQITDIKEKKRQIKLLKEGEDGIGGINAMLRRYNSNDELVLDLLERVENLDHTIIFCPSIEVVDQVTALINHYTGDENTALAFHSKIDEADADILNKYNSGESKVIVAVGKLNEGIDMQQTNNVVFWRETESPTIFQQQFGRGLRGKEVNVFDYVGGIRNMAWINSINQAIDQISPDGLGDEELPVVHIDSRPRESDGWDDHPTEPKHINIVVEGIGDSHNAISHTVDLQDLVERLEGLEISCDLTNEMVEEFFKTRTLDEWKSLKKDDRIPIKIGGNWLLAIASLYEIKWNPANKQDVWYNLLEHIFQVKIGRFSKYMVEEFFKTRTLDEWKSLKKDDRGDIKIGDNWLNTVASLYEIKWNPANKQDVWYNLLEHIFQVKIEREIKESLTKEIVEEFFKTKSLEERKVLKSRERQSFEIGGNWLNAISSFYEIIWDPIGSQDIWYNLLEQILQVKIERISKESLTKEMIGKIFKTRSLDEWKNLKQQEKQELKIWGNWLFSIASLYGIKWNPLDSKEIRYDLLEQIFQVKIEKFSKNTIEEFFKTRSLDERKSLKKQEKRKLKIWGNWLKAIASLYGIKWDPIGYSDAWYNLLERIFQVKIEKEEKEKKDELTKEMIEFFFKTKSLEKWKFLKSQERLALKILGNWLFAIARFYGIQGNPIANQKTWYELLEKIFDTKLGR